MKPLRLFVPSVPSVPSGGAPPPAHRQLLLACAAIVAVSLLWLCVQLLRESVAHADQARDEQRISANRGTSKAAIRRLPSGFAQSRDAADSADVRTH